MVMVNENGAFERVESVEPVELDAAVYDLDIDQTHNFVAGGIVTHNSVYAFRGADYRNLLRFEETFPDASVIVLDQNYRSTQRILDAANAVIANNAARRPKHLWTEQIGGELIVRYHAEDEHDEAQYVVHEINRLADQEGVRFRDTAVFYRTNAQSRVIEETLVRAGVPYRIIGGTKFYDRREVKDALAYLRSLVEPGRRGRLEAHRQRAQARCRRHERPQGRSVRAGGEPDLPRGAARRCRGGGHRPGARGNPRPARRDGRARSRRRGRRGRRVRSKAS